MWKNDVLQMHRQITCIRRFLSDERGGRKGGTNTAIPHVVAREYRNTASKFSQIPKPQLQMGKS